MTDIVGDAFNEAASLGARLAADAGMLEKVRKVADIAVQAVSAGSKLMFAGNGGSAAEAQHMAAEYVSRFKFDRPGLPAIALTTDTSILTAIGNDYGFERVFERQIEALGRAGDLLFLSSTSGSSPNVMRALAVARRMAITTVLMTGEAYHSPGEEEADIVFIVPSRTTARIQEMHLLIGHTICEIVERRVFGS